jgi:hypothetical protein
VACCGVLISEKLIVYNSKMFLYIIQMNVRLPREIWEMILKIKSKNEWKSGLSRFLSTVFTIENHQMSDKVIPVSERIIHYGIHYETCYTVIRPNRWFRIYYNHCYYRGSRGFCSINCYQDLFELEPNSFVNFTCTVCNWYTGDVLVQSGIGLPGEIEYGQEPEYNDDF